MIVKHYGVRKGSKKPQLREILPTGRPSLKKAQDEYDRLDQLKQTLAKKAARMIKVMALRAGDDLPQELIEIKKQHDDAERQICILVENHPKVRR